MDEIGGDPGASLWHGDFASRLDAFDQLLVKAGNRYPWFDSLHSACPVNGRGLLLLLLALLLLALLPRLVERLLKRAGRLEPNFRGDRILQSYGLLLVFYGTVLIGASLALLPASRPDALRWLVAILGYGVLGFADDCWGTKKIRGLRGHFRAAWRDHMITTGFVKAVGGIALALWLGYATRTDGPLAAPLSAGVIALSANAINLFDLRPGRAGALFLALAVPLLVVGFAEHRNSVGVPYLLFVVLPALQVWERDSRALAMMGDMGSNVLGACLGLALIETSAPPALLGLVLLLLIGLHLLSERMSLSRLIERSALLRRLDRLTGVR